MDIFWLSYPLPCVGNTSKTTILGLMEVGGLVAAITWRRAAGPVRAVTLRRHVARRVPVCLAFSIELITRQQVAGGTGKAVARVPLRERPRV